MKFLNKLPLLTLLLASVAGAAPIVVSASQNGCNGGGSGSCTGLFPYLLTAGDDATKQMTFDFRIAKADKSLLQWNLSSVVVHLDVWDNGTTKNPDTAAEQGSVFLLIPGVAPILLGSFQDLNAFHSGNRYSVDLSVPESDLAAVLAGLSAQYDPKHPNRGTVDLSIQVVANTGNFNLASAGRSVTLDFLTPEPAGLGLAGIGLLALGWVARKRVG